VQARRPRLSFRTLGVPAGSAVPLGRMLGMQRPGRSRRTLTDRPIPPTLSRPRTHSQRRSGGAPLTVNAPPSEPANPWRTAEASYSFVARQRCSLTIGPTPASRGNANQPSGTSCDRRGRSTLWVQRDRTETIQGRPKPSITTRCRAPARTTNGVAGASLEPSRRTAPPEYACGCSDRTDGRPLDTPSTETPAATPRAPPVSSSRPGAALRLIVPAA
jgi:hypothetical protein